jgi:transmembrane sensor
MPPAEQAVRWLVRLHSGAASVADRAAFELWRRNSPENQREFTRAEALWGRFNSLEAACRQRRRRVSAHRLRHWATAAAALLLLAAGYHQVAQAPPRLQAETFMTAKGERREVSLPDGSLIHMNADSMIVAEPAWWHRRNLLERGEALFEVTHDRLRSFIVTMGAAEVRDLGTRFDIRRDPEETRLAVFEGAVELATAAGALHRDVAAGQAVRVRGAELSALPPPDEATLTAWRQGRLSFAETSLAEVVRQLNRYRRDDAPLVLADPSLASLRVSGSFQTTNIDGVLHALQLALPIALHQDGTGPLVITSRPPAPRPSAGQPHKPSP